jgi:hypothetical protein
MSLPVIDYARRLGLKCLPSAGPISFDWPALQNLKGQQKDDHRLDYILSWKTNTLNSKQDENAQLFHHACHTPPVTG